MTQPATLSSIRSRLARLDTASLTILASWSARLVTAGAQLITIPMLARALGDEAYSVYVVLISLVAWFALADLGTGYSLQNGISRRRAGDTPHADDVVSSVGGMVLLLPLLLVVVVALAPVIAHAIWRHGAPQSIDALQLVAIAGVIFSVTAIGNIGYRILYAEQQGWLANALQGLASLTSLALVSAAVAIDMDLNARLLAALLAFSMPPAATAIAALVLTSRRSLRAGGRLQFRPFMHNLRASAGFLAFGALSLLTLQVDYFVLTRTVEPAQIVQYNVVSKVLGMTLILFQAMLQAHWPHSAEAASRGEWHAVNARLYRLMRLGGALVLAGTVAFAILEKSLMHIVTPKAPASLGPIVVGLYALYLLVRIWSDAHAMVLQSLGRMRIFLIYVPAQAAMSIGFQVAGARAWGVAGLIGGLTASFILSSGWVLPMYLRRVQRA